MRYISTSDRKYYSQLLDFFEAIQKLTNKYKWLITDIEATPSSKDLSDLFNQSEALILSADKLVEYLDKEGILKAFKTLYPNSE